MYFQINFRFSLHFFLKDPALIVVGIWWNSDTHLGKLAFKKWVFHYTCVIFFHLCTLPFIFHNKTLWFSVLKSLDKCSNSLSLSNLYFYVIADEIVLRSFSKRLLVWKMKISGCFQDFLHFWFSSLWIWFAQTFFACFYVAWVSLGFLKL